MLLFYFILSGYFYLKQQESGLSSSSMRDRAIQGFFIFMRFRYIYNMSEPRKETMKTITKIKHSSVGTHKCGTDEKKLNVSGIQDNQRFAGA